MRERLFEMRVLALVLAMSTGCSYALAQKPGPSCEDSGTDVADGVTAVAAGILAVIVWGIAIEECSNNGCNNDDDLQLLTSAIGLTAMATAFTLSSRYGARQNEACRRARGQLTDE